MAENNQDLQKQINDMNQKLDLVLEHVNKQRLKSEMVDDLMSDASIITKDAWDTTVKELDDQGIELDVDDMKQLIFKFLKNIKSFTQAIELFESANDLMKDTGPVINEMGVDAIHKLHEFEQKGYFKFINEMGQLMDQAVTTYHEMENEKVEKYGLWKTFRELNSKEMKSVMGYFMTFMKKMAEKSNNKQSK